LPVEMAMETWASLGICLAVLLVCDVVIVDSGNITAVFRVYQNM
jgi:hypothetical protein